MQAFSSDRSLQSSCVQIPLKYKIPQNTDDAVVVETKKTVSLYFKRKFLSYCYGFAVLKLLFCEVFSFYFRESFTFYSDI